MQKSETPDENREEKQKANNFPVLDRRMKKIELYFGRMRLATIRLYIGSITYIGTYYIDAIKSNTSEENWGKIKHIVMWRHDIGTKSTVKQSKERSANAVEFIN